MYIHRKAFIFLALIAQVILPSRFAGVNLGWYEPLLFEVMVFAWALATSMMIQLVQNYKKGTEKENTTI